MKTENKKLLLVEPPFYRLYGGGHSLQKCPLGPAYLAGAVLDGTGWDVQVYNADFDESATAPFSYSFLAKDGYNNYIEALNTGEGAVWDEIREVVTNYAPSVIGISTKTQNFASARILAAIAKQVDPSVFIIVGGPHPSMSAESCLQCPDIDAAVFGEGEVTLVEMLGRLESGEDLHGVDGVLFRDGDTLVRNASRSFIEDIDQLTFPHDAAKRSLMDYEKYPKHAFRFLFALRGCPYGCEFCGSREIWSRKVRFRTPWNVLEEIQGLQALGLNHVHFDDDTFGIRKDFIYELCGLIKTHCPELTWSCEITVNLVNEDLVRVLRESGCVSVQIGVESGNNEILRRVHKNTTIEKAFAAAEMLKGISVETFFMVGFPYETEDTLNDTWRAIKTIKADIVLLSVFTPYPGTDAFEVCRKAGLVNDDFDVSLYNHQSPENCFTPHIEKDQFTRTVKAIMGDVDRKNTRNKLMHPGRIIRNHGVLGVIRKIVAVIRNRFGGHISLPEKKAAN